MSAIAAAGIKPNQQRALRLLTAMALGVDSYLHFDLAINHDPSRSSVGQGNVFVVEALAAAVAAIAVLTSRRAISLGLVVAASSLVALIIYRYAGIGDLAAIPSMFQPAWYPRAALIVIAEAAATITAVTALRTRRAKAVR